MARLMRPRLVAAPIADAGLLAVAAVAVGAGGDPRDDVDPLEPATERGRANGFDVERIATGFNRPTYVGVAPGDARSLWILEQPGRVIRLHGTQRTIMLDLGDQVTTGAEQGLLGIAFHPDFATDRRLYLHWSDENGDTRVKEFRAHADRIDPRPIRELLFNEQPEENHNGGQLAFGPDGRLYLGLGDGGGAFDPDQRAQDLDDRLGKLISTDVDARRPDWRIELTGLRNPWRFSFDLALGELWLADVGQDDVEEINRVLLEPDEPPKNLGWSAFEGTRRVRDHKLDDTGELVWPVAQYPHPEGCSVTGGVVYAGSALPELGRRYVYGDFCAGALWTLKGTPEGRAEDVRREQAKVPGLTHIGTTNDGELLFASGNGALYRALPAGP